MQNIVDMELVKGYQSYSVTIDGKVRATAHVVQVQLGIYSIKVDGMWRGNLGHEDAIAFLETVDLDVPLDRSARRALLSPKL